MADITGTLTVRARGQEYHLHAGIRIMARLQAAHGQNVFQSLQPPPDAGRDWVPPLAIVVDLVAFSLDRHHAAEIKADPYLTDDIMQANPDLVPQLLAAAFPDVVAENPPEAGNAPGPRVAA
jgi:hypothetical protein